MERRHRHARFTILLAALAHASCGADLLNVEHTEPLPRPALPASVGPAHFSTEWTLFEQGIAWSADGTLIYYRSVNGPPFSVHELTLATRESRPLTTGATQQLRLAGDGRHIFHAPGPGTDPLAGIYRVPTAGGQAERVVEGAQHVFATAPDGGAVAWRSVSDSLFVRDIQSGQTTHVEGSGYPVSLSEGGRLLAHGLEEGPIFITDVAIGTSERVELPHARRALDTRWVDGGLEILAGTLDRLDVVRSGSGGASPVWRPRDGLHLAVHAAEWSPDGRTIAASVSEICIAAPCYSWVLQIDPATGMDTVLGSATEMISRARFTADGHRIAVTRGGRLHLLSLR